MIVYKAFVLLCFFVTCTLAAESPYYYLFSAIDEKDLGEGSTPVEITVKYDPTWDSLDKRPIPIWYDDVKFGIFIHWGVFSVPSFGSEWFWINWKTGSKSIRQFMKDNYKPGFTYQEFAKDFTAEFFNATEWSELFEASGAKYVVLTSKHHEGYTLWPSKYSFSWNSMDVGPHRDLVGELAEAIRRNTEIRFGLYHSLYEWFNPLYLEDKKNNFNTDNFVLNKIIPEMKELIKQYKPEILWSDGDWEATEAYWKSKEFLAWLYNESPVKDTVLTNDRWGVGTSCKHGDFYNCQDRYNPGILQNHKWENCMTIDKKSWGYRRNAPLEEYYSLEDLVKELVITVSTGGNFLMNVGPTKDGIIPVIFQERLRGIGKWLKINGEAIYKTKPWVLQNDTIQKDVWYTHGQNGDIFATLLSWPKTNNVHLSNLVKTTEKTQISILNIQEPLIWRQESDSLKISLPLEAHKGEPAWVIRITNLKK
ncbi:hypothetical protein TSAR_003392 [Trichomalopsis sarcophagae]|uniref:Putative alpha-L-fucosidase n=1 Tax=Trichomalopsis sarcophagae TaxID=543379 RepID=A0A232EVD8_9HYME|nr:hypothetical protein TSAR_003392 [Trichomalopsis sarcophagae]